MLKHASVSCIQITIIVALVCFVCGFLVQIAFHLIPQHDSLRGGRYSFVVDGQLVELTSADIKSLLQQSALTYPGKAADPAPPLAAPSGVAPEQHRPTPTQSEPGGLHTLQEERQIPNIVKAWRAAKIDWHHLVPSHNSFWERFGTPSGEGKLRALVAKETLITDYLTQFQESGLSGMYGHDYGPLTAYSGCNAFSSPCVIHDEQACQTDDLCAWSAQKLLCIDAWDPSIAPQTAPKTCAEPKIVTGSGFRAAKEAAECKVWVHQPAITVNIDSESQSMFYHWWATWSGIVLHWQTVLHADRGVHFFMEQINDPMFFQFFGLLSDSCWRRLNYIPNSVCFCSTDSMPAGQNREGAEEAAQQMLQYLGLENVQPPASKVRVGLISRRRKRFILNEYELVRRVEAMGYECVLLPLETMTLYEQMQALRSLDVLVGIHGSALDNAVFLHPGSVMVQLLPYKVEHRVTFRATAEAAKVKYLEWQLQDPKLAVFHWDLLEQANGDVLHQITKEQYLERGQKNADNRETLMFWINQDIIVPLIEWGNLIRSAVDESPAPGRGLH